MTAGGTRRGAYPHPAWVLPLLVLVTVAATALLYVRGDLNSVLCGGPCPARYVTAPEGLAAAEAGPDRPATVGEGAVDPDAVADAVADALSSSDLGERSGFAAMDARDGTVLAGNVTDGGTQALTPASTTKILTAAAVLAELGPAARFTTSVVRDGDWVVLVGGGDPYLTEKRPRSSAVEKADLATLAKATARAIGDGPVEVGFDDSLFSGPATSPGWESTYVGSVVAPVSALWIDRGRVGLGRSTDPSGDAARAFAAQLRERGVEVTGDPTRVEAPDAAPVATVRSAQVGRIVERFLTDSDNEVAEVLLRQAAIGAGRAGSFAAGAETVEKVLAAEDVPVDGLRLDDGSGLARSNRIAPVTLTSTLVAASRLARWSPVLSGLPVGGFTGTLSDRYARLGDARGLVRAKTGTLTGVHALAGIATLPGGRPVAFAVLADQTEAVNPLVTQAALDRVAADLAGCAC